MISITPEEILLLSKYVFDISGIKLDPQKGYLLESRFQPLISEFHCNSFRELYEKARSDRTGAVMNRMIDAITTNETYFFRDSKPFDLLSNKIIPDLIDRRRKEGGNRRIPIKIWSAACSTGQEIYSIGITLFELLKNLDAYNISILGTDISDDVVTKASYGMYNRFEVERGLPPHFLNKYFTKAANGWRIKDMIRSLARFEKRDLTKPFNDLGRFDIIFCRNVAIYFDHREKINLFKKIAQLLTPGGSLIVGASESLSGIADDFVARHYLKSMYYQLAREPEFVPSSRPERIPERKRTATPAKQPESTYRRVQRSASTDIGISKPKTPTPPASARPSPIETPPPVPPAPKPPVVQTSIAAETKKKMTSGSLLGSIRSSGSVKPSLLSSIQSKARDSRKTLLDEIKEESKTENTKNDR